VRTDLHDSVFIVLLAVRFSMSLFENVFADNQHTFPIACNCRQALATKKGASAAVAAPTAAEVAAANGEKPVDNYNPLLQGCRSIEHYERIKYINEGAYGMVFAARNRVTGEVVAIKQVQHHTYMHFSIQIAVFMIAPQSGRCLHRLNSSAAC
jgi:hypothetical protein